MYSFCSKFLKNHIEKNRISSFSSINSYLHKTETGQWSCYIALTLDSFITGIFLYNMAGWLADREKAESSPCGNNQYRMPEHPAKAF